MAAIQNDRDILLQAAAVRVVPVKIDIDDVIGLPEALKSLRIKATATTFTGSTGTTVPASITLTVERSGGLSGEVAWEVVAGTATLQTSGDSCTITGSTVVGASVTVRASVVSGTTYEAQIILTKLGSLSAQERVNLTTQVTGQLANGNVSGLGALALLNTVNLNTQTVGALNGQTQVTNLGTLAYANALYANQIGAGQLAAGVVYAGTVNASQVTAGSFVGKTFTGGEFVGSSFRAGYFSTSNNATGTRLEILSGNDTLYPSTLVISGATASNQTTLAPGSSTFKVGSSVGYAIACTNSNGIAARFTSSSNSPTILLDPITTRPAVGFEGAISYHTTHGFIFCDGTAWFRIAPSAFVQV